jgi:hypothetical protein
VDKFVPDLDSRDRRVRGEIMIRSEVPSDPLPLVQEGKEHLIHFFTTAMPPPPPPPQDSLLQSPCHSISMFPNGNVRDAKRKVRRYEKNASTVVSFYF